MTKAFHIKSAADQVAEHLRDQILRGVWQQHMPGTPSLARQLLVDHRVVIQAYELLEKQGLIVSGGVGRPRRINLSDEQPMRLMNIQLLPYDETDRQLFYLVDLQHRLMEAGHICAYSSISLMGVGMNVSKIKRYVEKTKADAWIVCGGSKDLLQWMAEQKAPAFAMSGRMKECVIAGCRPDKVPALRMAVRRLVELGHKRIVLLVREERRKPRPGTSEQAFLEELEANGIQTGSYNLPDWEDQVGAFHRCLDSLFRHTPPTAMIVDEMQLFNAAQLHLSQMGIRIPQHVSLVSTDPNPAFAWCRPTIAHIDWDQDQLVKKIVKWANLVARGRDDRRQDFTKAWFVEGDTVGPAPVKTRKV